MGLFWGDIKTSLSLSCIHPPSHSALHQMHLRQRQQMGVWERKEEPVKEDMTQTVVAVQVPIGVSQLWLRRHNLAFVVLCWRPAQCIRQSSLSLCTLVYLGFCITQSFVRKTCHLFPVSKTAERRIHSAMFLVVRGEIGRAHV